MAPSTEPTFGVTNGSAFDFERLYSLARHGNALDLSSRLRIAWRAISGE
jgi:hypothetical protein